MPITGHEKLNVSLKRENRDHEKVFEQGEPCNSVISQIPIFTAASHVPS